MATSVSDYNSWVGTKRSTPQALIQSARKALIYVAQVTLSGNYVTGGYPADLKQNGAKSIEFAIIGNHECRGVHVEYIAGSDKIRLFSSTTGAQIANGTTTHNGRKVWILVFASA